MVSWYRNVTWPNTVAIRWGAVLDLTRYRAGLAGRSSGSMVPAPRRGDRLLNLGQSLLVINRAQSRIGEVAQFTRTDKL
jgi:hypothetical protein